jgi:ABC-type glycerol-3-phosphate transport system substrate-binding protein
MGRRGALALAIAIVVAVVGLTAGAAEAQKKISLLTWNIPVYKEKIEGWIADFKKIHPDVQAP